MHKSVPSAPVVCLMHEVKSLLGSPQGLSRCWPHLSAAEEAPPGQEGRQGGCRADCQGERADRRRSVLCCASRWPTAAACSRIPWVLACVPERPHPTSGPTAPSQRLCCPAHFVCSSPAQVAARQQAVQAERALLEERLRAVEAWLTGIDSIRGGG